MEIFNNWVVIAFIILVMLCVTYTLIKAFLIHSFFWSNVDQVKTVMKQMKQSTSYLEQQHAKYAWNETGQPAPIHVIALRELLQEEMAVVDAFERNMALSSDMYGQVKYLVADLQLSMAIVFWLKHLTHRKIALEFHSGDALSPIEMEVVGARDFALATLPIIGWMFEARAVLSLQKALAKLLELSLENQYAEYDFALHYGILRSKLYALTGDITHKIRMVDIGLTVDHLRRDYNQVERIRKHFGFESADELLKYCKV